MALDELAATIEMIKGRIDGHRTSLAANETRTRQVLIDPLLSALGWDVSDPDQVELEYDVRGRRADYALLVNSNPVAVIEAKRLGHQLVDDNTMQVMNYANTAGIEYMVVTNGDEWKMYSVFERGAIEERVIMELDIGSEVSYVNALKSLSLWRANVGSGSQPVAANQPVFDALGSDNPPQNHEEYQSTQTESPTVSALEDEGWVTLDKVGFQTHDRWPKNSVLPGGQSEKTPSYRDLWIKVAEWLLETRGQTLWEECFDRYVGRSPDELSRKHSARQLSNGFWISVDYTTVEHGENIKGSLCHFGVDLRSIGVRFD